MCVVRGVLKKNCCSRTGRARKLSLKVSEWGGKPNAMRQLAWLICDLYYVTKVTEALDRGMELVNVRPQSGCFGPLEAMWGGHLNLWVVCQLQHPEGGRLQEGFGQICEAGDLEGRT